MNNIQILGYYHIINRGVEQPNVFQEVEEYAFKAKTIGVGVLVSGDNNDGSF